MKTHLALIFAILLTLAPWTLAVNSDVGTAEVELIFSEPIGMAACLADPADGISLLTGFKTSFYPSCQQLNGTYCSPPGSFTFCEWTPEEPEICICQSNNTWACG